MISLDSLKSSGKSRKRIGRSGSRGGTSGKGHKGQKARSGPKIRVQYEGGQMPLTRRFPKHGFNNAPFRTDYELVNIKDLEARFEQGAVVNAQALFEKGLIKGGRRLLKVLGHGTLSKKLVVHADAFSKSAAERITHVGGSVHHTKKVHADSNSAV
jgi:large subunit ribosomal protein L15